MQNMIHQRTRLVGKNSASCYVFCPTSEDDAGKEVRIELTDKYSINILEW